MTGHNPTLEAFVDEACNIAIEKRAPVTPPSWMSREQRLRYIANVSVYRQPSDAVETPSIPEQRGGKIKKFMSSLLKRLES